MSRRDAAVAAARSLGASGVWRRTLYEARKRVGALPTEFSGEVGSLEPSWQVGWDEVEAWWSQQPTSAAVDAVNAADRVISGEIPVFGETLHLGWPPRWRSNERTEPWTVYSDFGSTDIKDIWEPSRWGFLGTLLRADAATEGQDAQPRFLRAVESWVDANPPFRGENWMCAQESSLRGITALHALGLIGARDPLRMNDRALIDELISMTVERVAPTLGYARSQRNNHAISEAAFLWSAAALLDSPKDAHRAGIVLRDVVNDQFASDGSYAQYSFSYQRLALHTLLFVDLVCRTMDREAPLALEPVFERSLELLAAVLDPVSGRVPNSGGNDGALLFQLTACDITDYRPLVAHLAARLGRTKPFPNGPWDEEAAWFGHAVARESSPTLGVQATGSYHVLRSDEVQVVLRAGHRRHRPAHADMLHVDVSFAGHEIAFDAGTFRYTAEAPWINALAVEDVHNVPRLPGQPQARKVGRFLWHNWSDARLTGEGDADGIVYLSAELGLQGATLRRRVQLADGVVTVTDECSAPGMVVRWNLPEKSTVVDRQVMGSGYHVSFTGGIVGELQRSLEEPRSGWSSRKYGRLEPCTAVEVVATGSAAVVSRFVMEPIQECPIG